MRLKKFFRQSLRLAACFCVAAAGCTTSDLSRSGLPHDPVFGDSRQAVPSQVSTQHASLETSAERERNASTQFSSGVELAQFESASTDDPPALTDEPPALMVDPPAATDDPPAATVDPPAATLSEVAPNPPEILSRKVGGRGAEEASFPGEAPQPADLSAENPEDAYQLNLTTALAMVSGQNPQVAFAAQRYAEAYARWEAARSLWLPSIRAGLSYNKHEGRLQSSNGRVFDSSRGSLDTGLGVQSVGTGSPAVPGLTAQFHLSDAIFQPRIANQIAAARREATRATTHDLLLDTALAYLNLLQAIQEKAIADETFDNARQLADLTVTFAHTGQGPQADADRARTELVVRQNDVARAEEQIQVASARLSELLHIAPTSTILPEEPAVVPVELVDRQTPLSELLSTGMSNRPELAQSRHLVCQAVEAYQREKYAPLLPSAFLGVSYGEFGGGTGSTVNSFADRFDFDAVAYWELRNFGLGERAARDQARALHQQARLRQVQTMDRVARQVVEAHAQVQARYGQIAVAQSGIESARDSYRRNMERIRAGEGLPIEVLQSIQALGQARREYLRTVVDYNQAQFRLHRALGWPIQ